MQLLGVYRNCLCKAGLRYAMRKGGIVPLATNTQGHRDSAKLWFGAGIGGLVLLVLLVGGGYYYRLRMRERCKAAIRGLRL